jgi:hypothetical protein
MVRAVTGQHEQMVNEPSSPANPMSVHQERQHRRPDRRPQEPPRRRELSTREIELAHPSRHHDRVIPAAASGIRDPPEERRHSSAAKDDRTCCVSRSFRHAPAPAAVAILARAKCCCASSLGVVSICRIHRRPAAATAEAPSPSPIRPIALPIPIRSAPPTRSVVLSGGPPVVVWLSVMAPSSGRGSSVTFAGVGQRGIALIG